MPNVDNISEAAVEHVLVVPTSEFHALGLFQGFCGEPWPYLDRLLASQQLQYRPRPAMERDPAFKQLIPYVVLVHRAADGTLSLFQYTRGKGQGEQRLHRKRSVGVGGHICQLDQTAGGGSQAYAQGMLRELAEEVHIAGPYQERIIGLINDDSSEVGQVHLGVVHLCEVALPQVEPREAEMHAAGFQSLADLLADQQAFETWSQFVLQHLAQPEAAALFCAGA